jgi:hypothetical protein
VSARNCVGRVLPSGPANLTMHSTTRAILYKVFYYHKTFFLFIDSTTY